MNIIVGGIMQESNTFSRYTSNLDNFKRYYYLIGEEMNLPQKAENEYSGFAKAAREEGASLLPTMFVAAVSSGKISRDALNELKRILLEQLDKTPACDGILFALHGAWVAEDADDADGEIVTAIRDKLGRDIPLVITLDSHANITRKLVENVDGLAGYRTFPHVDFMETGYRAAKLLFSIIEKRMKPHIGFVKLPMVTPAENHQTYRGPMFELWQEALSGEKHDPSLTTSLFAVQPWLDIDEMGFSVVVVGDDPVKAASEAERLGALVWSKRKEFDVTLYTVPQVLDIVGSNKPEGPVVISDSADSPGAGSPGDSNDVLRQLLEHGVEQWLSCLLSMVDAPAAYAASRAEVGSRIQLTVGHTLSTDMGKPLPIEGVVTAAKQEGRFLFGGGTVANMEGNMGNCAVIAIGKLSLLLMENPTFTGDPAMYRSVGLEPLESNLVLVKSANQFRAEYEKLSNHIYILDTPGASTANLLSLPFTKVSRPMYPFDDDFLEGSNPSRV